MVIIKTPEQIADIRRSSQLAAQVLKYTAAFIKPGISTQKLNDLAHAFILDHQATPAPLGYNGYPKSICTSVNNVVCHGIPSSKQILREGDIVNIDITTILDGYYGDISATYPVGVVSPEAKLLIEHTAKSLDLAIQALKPGQLLNLAVGKTIEDYVSGFGYAPVKLLGGHGVGIKFHEDPFVYHFYNPKDKTILEPGMIFTIEPMINNSSSSGVTIDRQDGWTVRTLDGALSCQFEHTILITSHGHEVLTKL